MTPTLPDLNIPAILREHGLRPDKSLGQNFLQDSAALEEIVAIAEIQPDDSVLEIGAGLGSLTRYLAVSAKAAPPAPAEDAILRAGLHVSRTNLSKK